MNRMSKSRFQFAVYTTHCKYYDPPPIPPPDGLRRVSIVFVKWEVSVCASWSFNSNSLLNSSLYLAISWFRYIALPASRFALY